VELLAIAGLAYSLAAGLLNPLANAGVFVLAVPPAPEMAVAFVLPLPLGGLCLGKRDDRGKSSVEALRPQPKNGLQR
jgi:hypothetical protein